MTSDIRSARIFITGAAGFIGAALAETLLRRYPAVSVTGFDSLNDYYDPSLKRYRLDRIRAADDGGRWRFLEGDIRDAECLAEAMDSCRPEIVVHLAAQAGVRYSIEEPRACLTANIDGFFNVLDLCRMRGSAAGGPVRHLVFASSSSVYGSRSTVPFSTEDRTDEPVSFYAATKKADELLAHACSAVWKLPVTGARFFTVYGPAGRPDMAYFKFSDRLRRGESITLYNHGNCLRDFTYIDDIIDGLLRLMAKIPAEDAPESVPYRICNLGGGTPVLLTDYVRILAENLQKYGVLPADFRLEDHLTYAGMQPGDVELTCADTSLLEQEFGWKPSVPVETGLERFARWYAEDYAPVFL